MWRVILMKKNIKKFIAAISTSIMMMSFAGCGSSVGTSAEGGSKELNLICWSEYLPQEVIDGYEEKYGVNINMTTFSAPDEMLAKLQSSAEGTYDMIIGPVKDIPALRSEGIIDKLDTSKIENYKNIDPSFLGNINDPDNEYSIPYLSASAVIAVNTDVIKDDITSYADLLNPKYKDSMVIIEDSRAVTAMALIAKGYDVNDCSDEALNAAGEYLSELKPNIHAFNGDSPKTLLINGECPLGLIYGAECALAQEENPAIKGIYPKEGPYFDSDVMMATKGAKNAENAELLMNYILDGEVSSTISKVFPYINPNKEAKQYLDDDYLKNDLKNIPQEQLDKAKPLKDIGDDSSKIVDLWTKFKGDK